MLKNFFIGLGPGLSNSSLIFSIVFLRFFTYVVSERKILQLRDKASTFFKSA